MGEKRKFCQDRGKLQWKNTKLPCELPNSHGKERNSTDLHWKQAYFLMMRETLYPWLHSIKKKKSIKEVKDEVPRDTGQIMSST